MKTRQKRKPASQLAHGNFKRQANSIHESKSWSTTKKSPDFGDVSQSMDKPCEDMDTIHCKGSCDEQDGDVGRSKFHGIYDKVDDSDDETNRAVSQWELSEVWEALQEMSDTIPSYDDVEAWMSKELGLVRSRHNNLNDEFQQQNKTLRNELEDLRKLAKADHKDLSAVKTKMADTESCIDSFSTIMLSLQVESNMSKQRINEVEKQTRIKPDAARTDGQSNDNAHMDVLRKEMVKMMNAQLNDLREEMARQMNAQMNALREEMARKMDDHMTALREEMARERDGHVAVLQDDMARSMSAQLNALHEENAFLRKEMETAKSLREEDTKVHYGQVAAFLERNKETSNDNEVIRKEFEANKKDFELLRKDFGEQTKYIKDVIDWLGPVSADVQNLHQSFYANNKAIASDVGNVRRDLHILNGKVGAYSKSLGQAFRSLGILFGDGENSQSPSGDHIESNGAPQSQHLQLQSPPQEQQPHQQQPHQQQPQPQHQPQHQQQIQQQWGQQNSQPR